MLVVFIDVLSASGVVSVLLGLIDVMTERSEFMKKEAYKMKTTHELYDSSGGGW